MIMLLFNNVMWWPITYMFEYSMCGGGGGSGIAKKYRGGWAIPCQEFRGLQVTFGGGGGGDNSVFSIGAGAMTSYFCFS